MLSFIKFDIKRFISNKISYICRLKKKVLMKRICLSILLVVVSSLAFAQVQSNETKVKQGLQDYLHLYPQAQLRDVYKTCFQDYFGPGHLLSNVSEAEKYLISELEDTKYFGGPLYETTGIDGNYYRVNILVVARGIIPLNIFMDAFVRSAKLAQKVSIEMWHSKWNQIESIYTKLVNMSEQDKFDSDEIHHMLDVGNYQCHHSARFNDSYNFHYRIIHKDIFESEILPLLNK